MAIDYRARRRRFRRPVLPALGALGLAGAAAAVLLIVTAGTNPAPAAAFAGWSPTPTLAKPGESARAIAGCGLGRPVLVDTRGPFTAAVYANPKPHGPGQQPLPLPSGARTVGSCFHAPTFSSSATSSSAPAPIHAGQIQVTAHAVSGRTEAATMLYGRVGSGVVGVRVVLSDGSAVTATVSHGWYLVWWPGRPHATAAQITTRGRGRTYALPAAAQGGTGSCGGGCSSIGPVLTVGR